MTEREREKNCYIEQVVNTTIPVREGVGKKGEGKREKKESDKETEHRD